MKALSALLLITSFSAFAKTIPSLDDCKVTDRSKIWTGSYTVENTRTSGAAALKLASSLKLKGASVEVTKDILGVKRFETIELRTVLETNGTEVNSCEGVYSAIKSETCTVDAASKVCETICKIEWNGEDCR